jgi:hypothetical protein
VGGKLNKEEEKYSHLTLQAKDKLDKPFMVFRIVEYGVNIV